MKFEAGSDEWMTPPEIVEPARVVLGRIDLDPASSVLAQKVVKAEAFYTKETDGLCRVWHGNVFINPPYSRGLFDAFVGKLLANTLDSWLAVVNNVTETEAGQRLLDSAYLVCFPRGRIAFLGPDGQPAGNNRRGQMILYQGMQTSVFLREFSRLGVVR